MISGITNHLSRSDLLLLFFAHPHDRSVAVPASQRYSPGKMHHSLTFIVSSFTEALPPGAWWEHLLLSEFPGDRWECRRGFLVSSISLFSVGTCGGGFATSFPSEPVCRWWRRGCRQIYTLINSHRQQVWSLTSMKYDLSSGRLFIVRKNNAIKMIFCFQFQFSIHVVL